MCGFLGAIPAADPQTFSRALGTLVHRGPDGGAVWTDGDRITLGHRRLAILDTSSAGDQPMHGLGRYHLIFNGEIYNFVEVRRDLESKGHSFVSDSDTEVLIAAFAQWGPACLERLNGMWAFALWDSQEQKLFLSRDRMGEKPLFYLHDGKRFIFASEQKALLPFLGQVRSSPRFQQLCRNPYLYEGTEETLFAGISRFPAGHFGWFAGGRLTKTRYWAPLQNRPDIPADYGQQVEALRALLLDSCKMRMRSDVPIGTALSGGIDSSAVAAAIATAGKAHDSERMAANWQNAFVASFPSTVMDESHYARMVAQHLDIPLTEVVIDPDKSVAQLEHWAWLFEEVHEVNPIPHILLYQQMRKKGVIVSLDGHGGDELFCGYESSVLHALPAAMGSSADRRMVLGTYRDIHPRNAQFHGFSGIGIPLYLARQKVRSLMRPNPDPAIAGLAARSDSLNKHLLELAFRTVLPTLLRNYDHYSMISGVEVRIPLLDPRIVDFAFALPWSSKVRGGFTKAILRDAVAPWLPEEIVRRKTKIGFAPPIVDWMRGPLRAYLMDEIGSASFRQATLIDPAALSQAITTLIEGKDNANLYSTEKVWKEFSVYLWEKVFLQAQPSRRERLAIPA